MPSRRSWYKDAKYDHPSPPVYLTGDKSTVEVLAPLEETRIIRRRYDDGYVQEIHFTLMPGGWRKYTREDPGPAHPQRHLTPEQRTEAMNEALRNGSHRVHARGPIPGMGLGVTFDDATQKDFGRSEDFDQYYDEQKITKTTRADHSQRHVANDDDLRRISDAQTDAWLRAEYAAMKREDAAAKAQVRNGPGIDIDRPAAPLPKIEPFKVSSESSLPPTP